MIRLVAVSLLAGVVVVTAGLYGYFSATSPANPPAPLVFGLDGARVAVGSLEGTGEGRALRLDAEGLGVLLFPLPGIAASDYRFLRMDFSRPPPTDSTAIFWRNAGSSEKLRHYRLPGLLGTTLWLPLDVSRKWRARVVELGVVVKGAAGETVSLRSLELLPATAATRLEALVQDWLALVTWNHSSVNYYPSVRALGATAYPVPLVAAVFGVACLVLVLLSWRRQQLQWGPVALLFFCCWLSLDLLWQRKLLRQLDVSRLQYAGLDNAAKLAAGPDAALVEFTTEVKSRIQSPAARVFVSSRDDYFGMRAAYFTYPLNVYWERGASGLPAAQYIHTGDYIALIEPTATPYDPAQRALLTADGEPVPVTPVFSDSTGSLYRVM